MTKSTKRELEQKRIYYLKNKERIKEKNRLHSKKYYTNNKKKINKKHLERYVKNKKAYNETSRKYYHKAKEPKIRNITRRKYNDLKKECIFCKSKEKLQFHHIEPYCEDNFIILCRSCHLKLHGKEVLTK